MVDEDKTICPHCGEKMKKWGSGACESWGSDYLYVCFNDDCGYYQRGWDFTFQRIGVKASYRHRYDPTTGQTGPLPVNTPEAGKDQILPD